MARSLGDVIDSFIPEAAATIAADTASEREPVRSRAVALPVGSGDVLRAAIAWNLCVELSRAGAPCTLVVPEADPESSLWPSPGPGPLGSALAHTAPAAPRRDATHAVVLECPPAAALEAAAIREDAPERWLLLSSPDPAQLRRVHQQALSIARARPGARIGVTIHGVRRIAEAQAAFEELALAVEDACDVALASYGLLVDDLHLYRAIVMQRPIGLAHPAAPATRALADVAALLLTDLAEETE